MGEPPRRREAPDLPVEMGEFICPICGRQYPTLEDLHAHVRRAHRRPGEGMKGAACPAHRALRCAVRETVRARWEGSIRDPRALAGRRSSHRPAAFRSGYWLVRG